MKKAKHEEWYVIKDNKITTEHPYLTLEQAEEAAKEVGGFIKFNPHRNGDNITGRKNNETPKDDSYIKNETEFEIDELKFLKEGILIKGNDGKYKVNPKYTKRLTIEKLKKYTK